LLIATSALARFGPVATTVTPISHS
jgi:hypothetical protein